MKCNISILSHINLLVFALLVACNSTNVNPTGPDWPSVKTAIAPQVQVSGYGTPYPLDISTLGWEDGQNITPDGLTVYCFYSAMDLLAFSFGDDATDPCAVGAYLRGPFQSIMSSVPPSLANSCEQFANSDIVISNRNSVNDPFPEWSLSNVSFPGTLEGAPQVILNASNPDIVDYFAFTYLNPEPSNNSNTDDIAIYKNTSRNPTGNFELLPTPINGSQTTEDNPHLERITDSNLVLFFTSSDRPDTKGDVDIFYSETQDGGSTWSAVESVNFNSPLFEDMPHIWKDSLGVYWMYYMNSDSNIAKRKQSTPGDWKNWDNAETVIDKGNAVAVGEPTLTKWGDIAFGLIYDAGTGFGTDKTNRYDDDVWILPKKGSPFDK